MNTGKRRAPRWAATGLAALLGLAGCAVGPDYQRPTMDLPAGYKESGPWKTAQPGVIDGSQPWWEAYGDPTLNALIVAANGANQTIQQAQAQYRQARAAADAARAGFWPTVGANVSAQRARAKSNGVVGVSNSYAAAIDVSWEPDLWGAVRRQVESSDASTQASEASLAAARLSIQAALAQDYLQLRAVDREKDLYARTLQAYQRTLKLTQSQYDAGVALRSDVAQAEAQLRTAQAQAIDLDTSRNQLEHAIAILTGRAPAQFSLAPLAADQPWMFHVPAVPTGLPSDLLERRPDIAAAERQVASANAAIGVARAAYFPSLVLSATGGFGAASFAQWFNAPGRVWSLGAALAETIFDGGLRRARDAQAVAAFDASAAQYKQTVLGAFQEVEDNLSTLRVLDDEARAQDQAVAASRLSEQLALAQYRAGTTTFLAVATAQALTLSNERNAVQLRGRQMVASVALIKAVGGGWNASALNTPDAQALAAAGAAPAAPKSPTENE
ncbi:MAG: efflux transporter outer membrane subunit [Achromobacter sp.]|jgi:NodT family efflux transporter outer membrane factor (OMF) lipoprotein|nr:MULTISPECIES: efflux transporter outer membrane subunit [Achromobacter]MBN9642776.1 efflux transporter outer membrane subunit [Achromobacter sp.]MCG2600505.1 efflux transporter outer membrane subunit [Achromobacter sp.]MCG2604996.1 efflux transporter outer membrane subunit [Achromobacter sp.]CUJ76150.1 Outer membrane protein oprM precursor [Achromobacter sp. 2789STDY5608633]CUJ82473.1 Outer membrane protein oprM precursor [Achromobacter sp. 2789STDY5608615]